LLHLEQVPECGGFVKWGSAIEIATKDIGPESGAGRCRCCLRKLTECSPEWAAMVLRLELRELERAIAMNEGVHGPRIFAAALKAAKRRMQPGVVVLRLESPSLGLLRNDERAPRGIGPVIRDC
jgi:hypothetical protein